MTDAQAPVRGGDVCADPETLKAALLEIARQLGHGRPQVTNVYLGKSVVMRSKRGNVCAITARAEESEGASST